MTTSPSNVVKAYCEQFHIDFSLFLKCRAQELVEGGCMILTLISGYSNCWELLSKAIDDMVMQVNYIYTDPLFNIEGISLTILL